MCFVSDRVLHGVSPFVKRCLCLFPLGDTVLNVVDGCKEEVVEISVVVGNHDGNEHRVHVARVAAVDGSDKQAVWGLDMSAVLVGTGVKLPGLHGVCENEDRGVKCTRINYISGFWRAQRPQTRRVSGLELVVVDSGSVAVAVAFTTWGGMALLFGGISSNVEVWRSVERVTKSFSDVEVCVEYIVLAFSNVTFGFPSRWLT